MKLPTKQQILDSWTITPSGKEIYLLKPNKKDVCIEDIAHALSYGNMRYNGYGKFSYPVTQHSVIVKRIVEAWGYKELIFPALMHDAPEAYCQDIVRPLKKWLGKKYEYVQNLWEEVISETFGYDPIHGKDIIKKADNIAMTTEHRDVTGYFNRLIELNKIYEEPLKEIIRPMTQRRAKNLFLREFHSVTNGKYKSL